MSDICIIYASRDQEITGKLANLLGQRWDVWWAEELNSGDWERAVRKKLSEAKAIVAVISVNTEMHDIFRDELAWAKKKDRKIFFFSITEAEPPLGFGYYNRTNAFGWNGDPHHKGYKSLVNKIEREFGQRGLVRSTSIPLRNKAIRLPAFVFSVSSYETQIDPLLGVNILELLEPPSCLISAYDAYNWRQKANYLDSVEKLRRSNSVLFLDSGNYEAWRKNDIYESGSTKKSGNPKMGWRREYLIDIVQKLSPDVLFAFDHPEPKGSAANIIDDIISNTNADQKDLNNYDIPVCPIVHIPPKSSIPIGELAPEMVSKVALGLDPILIAIPERELGDGIIERAKTVRQIRNSLDSLGKYYPLHILGTGNPISMLILSAVGADSFDGLEWCRTVADWDTWRLFHFQHFDFFSGDKLGRLRPQARSIVENKNAPFAFKVACYNLEVFLDWTKEIQNSLGKPEMKDLMTLLIPGIGERIYRELIQ
jgi:queuine/archaeosine tRNA-ribosyltransferase